MTVQKEIPFSKTDHIQVQVHDRNMFDLDSFNLLLKKPSRIKTLLTVLESLEGRKNEILRKCLISSTLRKSRRNLEYPI